MCLVVIHYAEVSIDVHRTSVRFANDSYDVALHASIPMFCFQGGVSVMLLRNPQVKHEGNNFPCCLALSPDIQRYSGSRCGLHSSINQQALIAPSSLHLPNPLPRPPGCTAACPMAQSGQSNSEAPVVLLGSRNAILISQ